MKKTLPVLFGIFLLVAFSSSAVAAGNWRHGKKIFKQDCMSCHKRGGEAKRLKLNNKNKAGWSKFVNTPKAGKHEDLLNGMSDEQKKDLLQYLLKYAKDDNSSHLGCG